MGKMSELALLLDEFREANRRANELAEEISKVRWCTRAGTVMTFECPEEKPNLEIPIIVEVYV